MIGVDLTPQTVETVNLGQSPVQEPGVQNLLGNKKYNLKAINDAKQGVLESDVTVVVVPTPSGTDGTFSNEYVLAACDAIGRGIKAKGA